MKQEILLHLIRYILQRIFMDKIAKGGKETIHSDNLRITRMADGTVISHRIKSSSDGTPVVEINIRKSRTASGIKDQKIHFIKD